MSAYNFLLVDQSSPTSFSQRGEVVVDNLLFSDLRYVNPFRRYLRSNSKVVKNRTEFWTYFPLLNFMGPPSKSYTHIITFASKAKF